MHQRPTGASLSYFHAGVQRHLNKWVFGGITHAALLSAILHADSAPERIAVFIGEQAAPSTCPAHFIMPALLIHCSCHLHVFHHLHSHTWTLSQMRGLSAPSKEFPSRLCSVQRTAPNGDGPQSGSDTHAARPCNLQDC